MRSTLTLFLLLSMTAFCIAGEQTITLKDGSQIKGELTSINNGIYTVSSQTLGNVQVNADQVANINAAASPVQSNNSVDQNVQTMQAQVMADPAMMAEITQLIQDPQIIKALSDPSLLQAAMTKDTASIQNNPHAMELMNNPKIQELAKKLSQRDQKQ